jgi:diguanylate cyclase (GGDEF)-like protein/PAS domain S-box-containing protein
VTVETPELALALTGIVAAMAAALACAGAAQATSGRRRGSWILLGAGAFVWLLGTAVGLIGGELGVGGFEIVALLAAFLLTAAALASFPGAPPHTSGRARTLVDGLIVAGSVLFIAWTFGLEGLYESGSDAASRMLLATALGGTVLASCSVVMFTRARPAARPLLALVAGGFTALAVASAALTYFGLGGSAGAVKLLYAGWAVGWLLVALSARLPPDGRPEEELEPGLPGHFSVFVPSVPFAAGVLAAAVAGARGEFGGFEIWTGAIVIVLIVARQVLALVENISFWRNLQAKVEARTDELRRSEARFRSLVQNVSDVITVIAPDGSVRYQSPSVEAVFGYSADEIGPAAPVDLIHPEDLAAVITASTELKTKSGSTTSIEGRIRHRDGRWRHVEAIANNLLDDPTVGGFVVNTRDISERKEREMIARRSFHDPLTNLANRSLFGDRLAQALRRSLRREGSVAVLVLDLDDFKRINDSLGDSAGDDLLVAVGGRLLDCVRSPDTVGRLGGDEFAVLVEDVDHGIYAGRVAERVLDALDDPFEIGTRQVYVRGSVGIATGSAGTETAEELLRNADVAMYKAKHRGTGSYEFFEPDMHAALMERLDLERDLRAAIGSDELLLHYQPVVSLKSRSVRAIEALLRWEHPRHGLIPPETFIDLAEETGLIVPMGKKALNTASRQASQWRGHFGDGRPIGVHVNVSGRQLQDPQVIEDVRAALSESGLDPGALTLEITESAIVADQTPTARLQELRDLGVRVAVDDFGSGYSSLTYLRRLPVDTVKIDRRFIEGVRDDPRAAMLFRAIVRMSHSLGATPIAEGIETAEQAEELRRAGCDLGQGYYFARPADAAAALEVLRAGNTVLSGLE